MIRTYFNVAVDEQWRFPRTKKRRIRNKWAKRPENRRTRKVAMAASPAAMAKVVEALKAT